MNGALSEFSRNGYSAGSVNGICSAQNISKGIIYHYFESKDELFLTCAEECFGKLTEHLKNSVNPNVGSTKEQLGNYFTARLSFFQKNPIYQRIFCEAVITPPAHLADRIQKCRQPFDELNRKILQELLEGVTLRPEFTRAEAAETFRQFQDFINAKFQGADVSPEEFTQREKSCKTALDILLYGITDSGKKERF